MYIVRRILTSMQKYSTQYLGCSLYYHSSKFIATAQKTNYHFVDVVNLQSLSIVFADYIPFSQRNVITNISSVKQLKTLRLNLDLPETPDPVYSLPERLAKFKATLIENCHLTSNIMPWLDTSSTWRIVATFGWQSQLIIMEQTLLFFENLTGNLSSECRLYSVEGWLILWESQRCRIFLDVCNLSSLDEPISCKSLGTWQGIR